jgi:tRNA A-37 threonylcarbamoyl transferase component Bud32
MRHCDRLCRRLYAAPVTAPARVGAYRVERLLGAGSFATVWLGHDESLDARVAIKILADNWSHDLRVRERFLDEARMLWRLDHERIVRVHALGELADGRPYLVMAWADGGSLRDRLIGGPLPVDGALRLLGEIAAGVAVLHGNSIVHRDLTPGNVLFRSGPADAAGRRPEQVVIADLGLAKALAAASGLTARAGTPGYMAPEQDDPFAVVDVRADVYGLGRLGLHLLGVPPSMGGGPRIRLRDGVPRKVANVLRTATAQRPADRYPDAAAFGTALARAGTDPGLTGRRRNAAFRRRVRAVGAVLAVAGLTAGLAADAARMRPAAGTAVDATGRITVALPAGWRAEGAGWQGQFEPDGTLAPALVMAPDPDRWATDQGMPGAFVGLSRGIAAQVRPAAFVAGRTHGDCVAAPVRTSRQGDVDWVVAGYTSCPTGKRSIVEAAGNAPGSAGLVYVQVAPPAGSDADMVDALLAGVRVR